MEQGSGRSKTALPSCTCLVASFLLAVASFWYYLAFCLAANDTAWLMRAGQYIIATGCLPAHDIFSWTCTERPWVLYQWLFEVALGAIFNFSASRGLWISAFITTATVGILYFYILPRQWLILKLPLAVIFTFLAFTLCPPWFFIRPQLVSHFFIALFINACERFRLTGHWQNLWYLPLLTLIWANCHPLWIVGLVILGTYAVCSAGKTALKPAVVLAVCLACVLVNPYGAQLIGYEWYFGSANNFKAVHELRSLLIEPPLPFYPFLGFCAVSVIILIWRRKFVPLVGLILSAFGMASALAVNKLAPAGALLIWPFLGFALAGLPENTAAGKFLFKIKSGTQTIDAYLNGRAIRMLILALIMSAACFLTRIPTYDYAIVVFAYGDLETMKFLATHRLARARVFNDEPTGSLMIYFNILPVFCDGRVDFYGKQFCDRWLSCINGDAGWQQYLHDIFHVNEIVIKDSTGLFLELLKSPDWLCAYDNGLRSIWLPNDRLGKDVMARWHCRLQRLQRRQHDFSGKNGKEVQPSAIN